MNPMLALVGLVVAGVGAQWLAVRLRFPSIVLLLGTGILVGPVLDILEPDRFFGDLLSPFVKLSVAVVLFEGGLSLRWREAKRLGWPLWSLCIVGLLVTFSATTALGIWAAGLTWQTAATIGAILVVTGPTVIKPMLRQARLPQRPSGLLKWEGIVNDPLGALLAVLVLQFATLGGEEMHSGELWATAGWLGLNALEAAALGLASGWLLGRALLAGIIPEHLKALSALAMVLAVFAIADEFVLHESGLLAVTVMGVTLANSPQVRSVEDVRRFKEEITVLLISVLFIVLSARLQLDDLKTLTGGGLVLIGLVLFVVRPLAIGLATLRTRLPWQERVLIGWIAPRGVVAAAVGGAFGAELGRAGVPDANLLTPIIFGVIITTVLLHGLTIRPLAARLGLLAGDSRGLLIVGASAWTVDLARALKQAGLEVVIADNRYRRTSRARMQGITVVYGDVLHEDTLDDLPMERIGSLLAATDDEAYNSLVCTRFIPFLGRERVLELSSRTEEGKEVETHLAGRMPWGEGATWDKLVNGYWHGRRFKVTELSEEYDWARLLEDQPGAMPFFTIAPRQLRPVEADDTPGNDVALVYYAAPQERSNAVVPASA